MQIRKHSNGAYLSGKALAAGALQKVGQAKSSLAYGSRSKKPSLKAAGLAVMVAKSGQAKQAKLTIAPTSASGGSARTSSPVRSSARSAKTTC